MAWFDWAQALGQGAAQGVQGLQKVQELRQEQERLRQQLELARKADLRAENVEARAARGETRQVTEDKRQQARDLLTPFLDGGPIPDDIVQETVALAPDVAKALVIKGPEGWEIRRSPAKKQAAELQDWTYQTKKEEQRLLGLDKAILGAESAPNRMRRAQLENLPTDTYLTDAERQAEFKRSPAYQLQVMAQRSREAAENKLSDSEKIRINTNYDSLYRVEHGAVRAEERQLNTEFSTWLDDYAPNIPGSKQSYFGGTPEKGQGRVAFQQLMAKAQQGDKAARTGALDVMNAFRAQKGLPPMSVWTGQASIQLDKPIYQPPFPELRGRSGQPAAPSGGGAPTGGLSRGSLQSTGEAGVFQFVPRS